MIHFDEEKLKGLHTAGELLDRQYGKEGTESRELFEQKARACYRDVIPCNK